MAFLYPVNLLDLNLDSIIELDRGKVQVYGLDKGPLLPKQGHWPELPCPADIQVSSSEMSTFTLGLKH